MSHQRVRKPAGVGDTVTRSSMVKAAGDTVPCSQPNQNERSRSKNKIPKSIRYDLESALVSLCDVWFEDIKPHLIRNNIKLHVDGVMGTAGTAAGDHAPSSDTLAKGCDHLDPASSAVDCELCRLLFNASNSIESAVSQAANNVSVNPPAGSNNSQLDITE